MIECKVGAHKYATERLYFEDFKKLGIIWEEKLYPLAVVLLVSLTKDMSDRELMMALYQSFKDAFNREDINYLSDLLMNREHLLVDGKRLDNAEWEKHWQKTGYFEYRAVAINFAKEHLGNFSVLSALLPQEWANKFALTIDKLMKASVNLSEISVK